MKDVNAERTTLTVRLLKDFQVSSGDFLKAGTVIEVFTAQGLPYPFFEDVRGYRHPLYGEGLYEGYIGPLTFAKLLTQEAEEVG